MSQPQSAIIPEANPFSLQCLLKINANHAKVLEKLKALPELVAELNKQQPGANLFLSLAFTHAFWQKTNQSMPEELEPFKPLGQGETQAPATETDVLLHCHSTRHDLNFYVLRHCLAGISDDVEIVDETYGFRYLDSRDMTDFIDGTENPEGDERRLIAVIPEGEFAGGSYVMLQRYVHNLPAWNRLNVSAQEKVIGRTKPDSIELDNVPAQSHVGRVDIKEDGKGLKMVRHSLPYGSVSGEHGLLFIAYCNRLHNFKVLLDSMFGETDGKTDHLLRFTQAVTGAYFFAPSEEMLASLQLA
ncbi:Dyp-type peroxidase [Vibrio gangliei]|uniref:Dyp-type peroxidase n=1 Tax=Vibrio gangliei TaxID=2077090 RepID=UPI000D01F3DE|nr:Dyp-type peroxidase [Vibrio gangliei]